MPLIDGLTFRGDPIKTFLFVQLILLTAVAFGAALGIFSWAIRHDRWDLFADPLAWHAAAESSGFGFWLIGALQFGAVAWSLRSGFWASTLLPTGLVFPALWFTAL